MKLGKPDKWLTEGRTDVYCLATIDMKKGCLSITATKMKNFIGVLFGSKRPCVTESWLSHLSNFQWFRKRMRRLSPSLLWRLRTIRWGRSRIVIPGKIGWSKLQSRYARKTVVNKIGLLYALLNTKFTQNADIGDQVATLESHFSRLASMNFAMEEQLKIAIHINYLSAVSDFLAAITWTSTFTEGNVTWQFVNTVSMKVKASLQHRGH